MGAIQLWILRKLNLPGMVNCPTLTNTKRCTTKSRCVSVRCIARGCGQVLQQERFIHGFRRTGLILTTLIFLGSSGSSHHFFSSSAPSGISFSGSASDLLPITNAELKKMRSERKSSYLALHTTTANAWIRRLSILPQVLFRYRRDL